MEIQLILGPNNSGKSLYAEALATQNSGSSLFYIATMVPHTSDNFARIEKHRIQREGKGFHTIEEPWNVDTLSFPENSVVLLEDASNLLANGIFQYGKNGDDCFQKIVALAEHCQKLLIVSISGFTPSELYDAETNAYILQLNELNERLKSIAVKTIEL